MTVFARIYPPAMRLIDAAGLRAWRAELTRGLDGDVLEVGCGPGFQRQHLPVGARVVGLEPDPALRARANRAGYAEVVDGVGERLPFPDASFDHVVISMVLCTAPAPSAVVREAARVLRPGGTVRLLEHVRAERLAVRLLQRVLHPVWLPLAGGCRLDHDTVALVRRSGLQVDVDRVGLGGALVLLTVRHGEVEPPRRSPATASATSPA